MANQIASTKQLTASGEVGIAGQPIRVYKIIALSGGTVGNSTFKSNGSSGTTLFTALCTAINTDNIFDVGGTKGMVFPLGCYWTKDANTTDVKVIYETDVE